MFGLQYIARNACKLRSQNTLFSRVLADFDPPIADSHTKLHIFGGNDFTKLNSVNKLQSIHSKMNFGGGMGREGKENRRCAVFMVIIVSCQRTDFSSILRFIPHLNCSKLLYTKAAIFLHTHMGLKGFHHIAATSSCTKMCLVVVESEKTRDETFADKK